jgi:hypothetical protein
MGVKLVGVIAGLLLAIGALSYYGALWGGVILGIYGLGAVVRMVTFHLRNKAALGELKAALREAKAVASAVSAAVAPFVKSLG